MGLFNWPCIEYVKLKGIDRILEDHESHLNYLCENHDISSCRSLGFYYDSAKRHDDSAQIYKKLCNPTRPSNIDCWEYYKSAIKADQINEAILMAEKLCKTYYSQECLDFAEFLKASGHNNKADYYFKLGCWQEFEKACDHSGSMISNFIWKQRRFNELEQSCRSGKPLYCLQLLYGIKKNNGNINDTISLTRSVASANCSLGIKEDCSIELFMDCFTDQKESAQKRLANSCLEGSFNACRFERDCLNPW